MSSASFTATGARLVLLSWVFLGLAPGWLAAESPFRAALAEESAGHRVAMVSNGYDALLLRVHLIRQAKRSIDLQTFIWSNDECGRLMVCELIEAARRGVKVRIIADHMFSDQDVDTMAFLATVHPNFTVKHYRPTLSRIDPNLVHTATAGVMSFHGINQRMHSKIMLFDGKVLITGGRNIENGYFDHATELNYRDRDVVAVGPLAEEAAKSFEQFWTYRHVLASQELSDVAAAIRDGKFRRYPTRADYDFGGYFAELTREADDDAAIEQRFGGKLKPVARAVFLSDEPGKRRGFWRGKAARITRELKRTLEEAESSVVLQTPYLVLSNPARDVFRRLQRRRPGMAVRISTNSFASTDNILAYSANYRLRNRYVEDLGLQIHEFKPQPAAMAALFPRQSAMAEIARERIAAGRQKRLPFLCVHAKSLVIDDRVAFVGSYNLDPRSENLNTEVGLLIEDEAFARELRAEIEADMRPENSWVIARRSLPLKLEVVNGLIGGVLSLAPLDVWPIQNTSSFELRPGAKEVTPADPTFHANYREAGPFPGTEGLFTTKEILTRIYKAVGAPLTPIL